MPRKLTKSVEPIVDGVTPLKNLLALPYDQLEEMNLAAKAKRDTVDPKKQEIEYRAYLTKETRIKFVILCFADIEGKLHMIEYDKKFLLESSDNLTFDGSSIRGFTAQHESDLRLSVDWTSIVFVPSDIFGPGKVLFFANVLDRKRETYESDFRGLLQNYSKELKQKKDIVANASAEIEGFIFKGIDAEQNFGDCGFELVATGGYYRYLPLDTVRTFIDNVAHALETMGFEIEKNHPEVSPSQFEINFKYTQALRAADQILLYKLVCRQVANNMGLTASFLPKPVVGINGSGMHTNFSLNKGGKNMFYDPKGQDGLSKIAWDFLYRILNHAGEICLNLNSSVNAYRRLDPHFEAPNQIKVSAIDRGSMIRLPVGNDKTTRIEVRSVAPDSNPYLVLYTIMKTGFEGDILPETKRDKKQFLPGNIYDALTLFEKSEFITRLMGESNKEKYLFFKKASADRCAKELGTKVKEPEVVFHHEVTNQVLWNNF